MKEEKNVKVTNGYVALSVLGVFLLTMILGIALFKNPIFLGLLVVILFIAPGFFTVNPNGSKVLVLFGAYKGTVRENGFHWTNPFYSKQRISLRARNFDSERVKVNDKVGNPILINVIAGST